MHSEDTSPSGRRLWLPALALTVAGSVVLFELTMAVCGKLLPALFVGGAYFERTIDRIEQTAFDNYATAVLPPMMWDTRPNSAGETTNCLGAKFATKYDASGARQYDKFRPEEATVLLIGDSYTHGDEVADDETIAANLGRRHGIAAANLGVGGYSPLQAVLKAKERLARFPRARMVVLGVMYENIRRTANGYSGVFHMDASGAFGVRPLALPGTIRLVPPSAYADIAAFKAYAKVALRADFWLTPDLRFPYTLSLVELAGSRAFHLRQMSRVNKFFDVQYQSDFADPTLSGALFTVVKDFFAWASASKVIPAVVFIPQNRHDVRSAERWIGEFASQLPLPGNIRNMATEGIDWSRYNQKSKGDCHPSAYGYAAIANAFAPIIKSLDLGRP